MKSGKPENLKSRKPENQHAGRAFQKFSTQLVIDSILAIKRIALEEHRKDYDVFQEAVDAYLKSKKR